MEMFEALVLAVIQGITEWLPISSDGHLAIAQHYFGLKENIGYDVLLHVATLIVIIAFFWKDAWHIVKDKDYKMMIYIIIGTIPIVIVGLLIKDSIQEIFNNLIWTGVGLIVTGVILLFTTGKAENELDPKKSIIIGLFQATAILPGVSRSGTSIGSAVMLGVKRDVAVRFSFLLAMPAIFGAAVLNINEISGAISFETIIGFIVTMIISIFVLKLLIEMVKKNKLRYFSYYCFVVGSIILVLQFI